MPRWEIDQVDQLITHELKNDSIIKTKMGISVGDARISLYRVVRDTSWFPYIYGYCIPGPDAPGQGTSRIQANIDYALEVRTVGAPTNDSEAIVERIDDIVGNWVKKLTPAGNCVVSARRRSPIAMVETGENPDIYYSRRGGVYKFAVVSS